MFLTQGPVTYAALTPRALNLGDTHAGDTDQLQSGLGGVQFERSNYCNHQLHRSPSL